jgi:hypothetical protein
LLRPRATRRLQRACCRSRATTLTRSVLRRWERAAAAGRLLAPRRTGTPLSTRSWRGTCSPSRLCPSGEAAGRRRARVANGTAPAQRAHPRYCDE